MCVEKGEDDPSKKKRCTVYLTYKHYVLFRPTKGISQKMARMAVPWMPRYNYWPKQAQLSKISVQAGKLLEVKVTRDSEVWMVSYSILLTGKKQR